MAGADANFAAGAAEYLQAKNYKALAEYMSAEVRANAPASGVLPFTFTGIDAMHSVADSFQATRRPHCISSRRPEPQDSAGMLCTQPGIMPVVLVAVGHHANVAFSCSARMARATSPPP